MSEINYKELHAYMLQKTSEYYQAPPAALVDEVLATYRDAGQSLTRDEARQLVTPLQIQRYVKAEMQKKWPDFMAAIPSNPLKSGF